MTLHNKYTNKPLRIRITIYEKKITRTGRPRPTIVLSKSTVTSLLRPGGGAQSLYGDFAKLLKMTNVKMLIDRRDLPDQFVRAKFGISPSILSRGPQS